MSDLHSAKSLAWTAVMTNGVSGAPPGGCGGCAPDDACSSCRGEEDGADQKRMQWAEMIAESRGPMSAFWSAALTMDAYRRADGAGNTPRPVSSTSRNAAQAHQIISAGSAVTGQLGWHGPGTRQQSPVAIDANEDGEGVWWWQTFPPVPPCPPPGQLKTISNADGSIAGWECVTPSIEDLDADKTTWVPDKSPAGGHWAENDSRSCSVPETEYCCCPVKIDIVGGGPPSGSDPGPGGKPPPKGYKWQYPWSPNRYPSICKESGHAFDVKMTEKWEQSDVYGPCILQWLEWNSGESTGGTKKDPATGYESTNSPIPPSTWHDRTKVDPTSPVFREWNRSASAPGLKPADAKKIIRGLPRGVEKLTATDTPCDYPLLNGAYDSSNPATQHREVEGEVIVIGGCPTCPIASVRVHWAQSISFTKGVVTESRFAASPSSSPPGDADVVNANDSIDAYKAWKATYSPSWSHEGKYADSIGVGNRMHSGPIWTPP